MTEDEQLQICKQVLYERSNDDRPMSHITAEYDEAREAARETGDYSEANELRYRLELVS